MVEKTCLACGKVEMAELRSECPPEYVHAIAYGCKDCRVEKGCKPEVHRWKLCLDGGSAYLECTDPCTDEKQARMKVDPSCGLGSYSDHLNGYKDFELIGDMHVVGTWPDGTPHYQFELSPQGGWRITSEAGDLTLTCLDRNLSEQPDKAQLNDMLEGTQCEFSVLVMHNYGRDYWGDYDEEILIELAEDTSSKS